MYKYLLWAGTVVLVILAIFLLVLTGQVAQTANPHTVSFSGEGKILAKPDIAVVYLSLITEAKTAKAAQDDNSAKSQATIAFLKKQKIDEKDIKTTGYNISPQYIYSPVSADSPTTKPPQIYSYQVNQTIEIKVRDLAKVSEILDGVVLVGVNQISGLIFQTDDPEKLKAEARELAIKDAKEKANELKKQLGIRLGKIINFSEGFSGIPSPILWKNAALAGDFGGGPEIPSGENELTVKITLTYQIK